MKNLFYVLTMTLLLSMTLLGGCSKQDRLDHIDANAPAPAQVTNVTVSPNEGGGTVTYNIPSDANLSYVKAVYEIQPGVLREAKSSIYADTLALVGFGDTLQHEIKIYSVGKNEKASDPVIAYVTPKIPPVRSIFNTVDMTATFSGVSISFDNPTKANVSLELLEDTTGQGTWSPLNVYYTAAATGKFTIRGLASVQKRFAVLVRDRWNNKSDTLIKTLLPLFEVAIPKVGWVSMRLPTDDWTPANANYSVEKLWDGKWASISDGFASRNGSPIPSWFTIDLGKKVFLSRFKEHQAPTSHLYTGSGVKRFELWGSNNPSADGSWDNWVLLGTFTSFKPSGLPLGQITDEDRNYGNVLGEDFDFTEQPPAVRYLRWKSLETYSSTGQVVISEIDLFGSVEQ